MGKTVYRLRVDYREDAVDIRSVGKNPRGSTFALNKVVMKRPGPGEKVAESAVQEVINRLCPNQVRTPL